MLSSRRDNQLRQVVNQQMVQAYWHIGRLIVEEEQRGRERAEYGKRQLETLARRLQDEFGKGFDATNLRKNASVLSDLSNSRHTVSRIELVALPLFDAY